MTIENILEGQYRLDLTREEVSDLLMKLRCVKLSWKNVNNINKFLKDYKIQYEDEIINYILYIIDTIGYDNPQLKIVKKIVIDNRDLCEIIRKNSIPKSKTLSYPYCNGTKRKKTPLIIVSEKDPYGEEDWND